ncbi:MAG TPA: DUF222 domain-containing protein [Acidimicrobiia bacterium]|nr:DUF222 domain-containing protein [Acidimicrobiia bacterium]
MSVALSTESDPEVAGTLREAVMGAGARWTAAHHRLLKLIAALDSSREWTLDGAVTCAHWVADALDVEISTAREWLRIGRALGELTLVDKAFAEGRLSYSKVRALTRVATAENQTELCELAQRLPAGRLVCALAAWQARHETPGETDARQHASRFVVWRMDVDGTIIGSFRLPPLAAAMLTTAIDSIVRHRRPDASADASGAVTRRWPSVAQQRADALVELATGGGGSISTEVILHVRGDGCSLDDGTPVAGSVVQRIAPDAFLRALIHDARGRPIDASGRRRHPSVRQQRVVKERDRVCIDCGATDFIEYDHDPPFDQSGQTVVAELHTRCWNCHHRRHKNERRE